MSTLKTQKYGWQISISLLNITVLGTLANIFIGHSCLCIYFFFLIVITLVATINFKYEHDSASNFLQIECIENFFDICFQTMFGVLISALIAKCKACKSRGLQSFLWKSRVSSTVLESCQCRYLYYRKINGYISLINCGYNYHLNSYLPLWGHFLSKLLKRFQNFKYF